MKASIGLLLLAIFFAITQSNLLGIDLADCGISKGCIFNSQSCSIAKNCSFAASWYPSPDDANFVRFELSASLQFPTKQSSKIIEYLAFGFAPDYDKVMSNASVMVCGFEKNSSEITAHLLHLPRKTSFSNDNLKLVRGEVRDDYMLCVVDRVVNADANISSKVFSLNHFWYPTWAVGGPFVDGKPAYHDETKHGFTNAINFSSSVFKNFDEDDALLDDPEEVFQPLKDAPKIDFKDACLKKHRCIRHPEDCSSPEDCEHVVIWSVSPDDKTSIRFEMLTVNTRHSKKKGSEKIQYLAFGVAPDKHFMSNASVLVCGLSKDNSKASAYYSHNEHKYSEPLPADQLRLGLKMIRSEITGSHFLCVVDRKMQPSSAGQSGLVFDLSSGGNWHPAWAVGPNTDDGFLRHHYSEHGYHHCSIDFTADTAEDCGDRDRTFANLLPWLDKATAWKIHGICMTSGWMVFIAAAMLTPRYHRAHWSTSLCGDQVWFVVHRAFTIIGLLLVLVGLLIILYVNNFLVILPNTYPDLIHPITGLLGVSFLFANPIVALFRCEPGHRRRYIFARIHGIFGGAALGFGITTIVIGAFMVQTAAFYAIVGWVLLHFTIELLFFLRISRFFQATPILKPSSPNTAEHQHTEPVDQSMVSVTLSSAPVINNESEISSSSSHKNQSVSFKVATVLFFCHHFGAVALVVVASTLLIIY